MPGRVIFVVGLPGSGKSEFLRTMQVDRQFDDFKADAFDNNSGFDHARKLRELLDALRAGETCVVSDIDFCRREAQEEAERSLRSALPTIAVEWLCFENDPDQCIQNVDTRAAIANRNLDLEIRNIARYSRAYSIPPNARRLQVWRPASEEE